MADSATRDVASPGAEGVQRSVQRAPGNPILALLRWVYAPVLSHRRAFFGLNLIYFGGLLLGVGYAVVDPAVQRMLLEAIGTALTSPTSGLSAAGEAYLAGELLPAVAITFGMNLVQGTVVYLMAPSLLIPFGGIATGLLRAVLWGVLFAPVGIWDASILPHVLTALIEGEAYVIAMLGVWMWWRSVFGASGRRGRAWVEGLKKQGRIILAVAFTLIVSAVYEVLEVVYLIPRL